MSTADDRAERLTSTRPQGLTPVEPASAIRILVGTATVYLLGRDGAKIDGYVVRSPGDVDAVTFEHGHAGTLVEKYATERVPLSATPAWPELSARAFAAD